MRETLKTTRSPPCGQVAYISPLLVVKHNGWCSFSWKYNLQIEKNEQLRNFKKSRDDVRISIAETDGLKMHPDHLF